MTILGLPTIAPINGERRDTEACVLRNPSGLIIVIFLLFLSNISSRELRFK